MLEKYGILEELKKNIMILEKAGFKEEIIDFMVEYLQKNNVIEPIDD